MPPAVEVSNVSAVEKPSTDEQPNGAMSVSGGVVTVTDTSQEASETQAAIRSMH